MNVTQVPCPPIEGHTQCADDGKTLAMLHEIKVALRELQEQVAGRVKEFYTVDELAQMTGRAPYTVRTWIREGRIRAERLNGTGPRGRLLVPRAELDKLIRSGQGKDIVPDLTDRTKSNATNQTS